MDFGDWTRTATTGPVSRNLFLLRDFSTTVEASGSGKWKKRPKPKDRPSRAGSNPCEWHRSGRDRLMRRGADGGAVVSAIQDLWDAGSLGGLCDAELLIRFASRREEAAFAMLVRRHGPLVLGVCRRVLGDVHAAEDASQATFLVLARKAGSIAAPERLASWLHGVALRTSRKAKAGVVRRRERELIPGAKSTGAWTHDPAPDDVRPVIDEELARLPEKYRAPVLLCDLEGQSIDEAASLLAWPRGTVGTRLAKARAILKSRLVRRGLGLGTGLVVLHSSDPVSAAWIHQTTRAHPQLYATAGYSVRRDHPRPRGIWHLKFSWRRQ